MRHKIKNYQKTKDAKLIKDHVAYLNKVKFNKVIHKDNLRYLELRSKNKGFVLEDEVQYHPKPIQPIPQNIKKLKREHQFINKGYLIHMLPKQEFGKHKNYNNENSFIQSHFIDTRNMSSQEVNSNQNIKRHLNMIKPLIKSSKSRRKAHTPQRLNNISEFYTFDTKGGMLVCKKNKSVINSYDTEQKRFKNLNMTFQEIEPRPTTTSLALKNRLTVTRRTVRTVTSRLYSRPGTQAASPGTNRLWKLLEDNQKMAAELEGLSNTEIQTRINIFDSNIRVYKSELTRLQHELKGIQVRITENNEKIKLNKQLPYLVSNVIETLELSDEEQDSDVQLPRTSTSVAIKTSTRQTVFLPVPGLIDPKTLKPGDLVGVNKDSYLILDTLPAEYDSRVKAMELDEKPTEEYSDIGGLDKQIEELIEAVVLPMTHKEKFDQIGIKPPKGVLMHGPPGTGKTLMARACAAQTNATFLKLAGPQLVQMFIGDGAKMVRDAFALAKEKSPAIIFIDELDAVGARRHDADSAGGREVQRTMLELLNQLDGFSSDDTIKVIAATNRPDILDPALLRSGRLDRKIEFPHPNLEARTRIMQIHSRKMNYDKNDVNFEELARTTDDFNGAMLKAVCVEAGMIALKRGGTMLSHEDYIEGIAQVQAKKKTSLNYYA